MHSTIVCSVLFLVFGLLLCFVAPSVDGGDCLGANLSVPDEVYFLGGVRRYNASGYQDAEFPSLWRRTVSGTSIIYNVTTVIPPLGCSLASLSHVLDVTATNVPGNLTYRSSAGNTFFFPRAVTCHGSDSVTDWPVCHGFFFNSETNSNTTLSYNYCCEQLIVTTVLTSQVNGATTIFQYQLDPISVTNGRTLWNSNCFDQVITDKVGYADLPLLHGFM